MGSNTIRVPDPAPVMRQQPLAGLHATGSPAGHSTVGSAVRAARLGSPP